MQKEAVKDAALHLFRRGKEGKEGGTAGFTPSPLRTPRPKSSLLTPGTAAGRRRRRPAPLPAPLQSPRRPAEGARPPRSAPGGAGNRAAPRSRRGGAGHHPPTAPQRHRGRGSRLLPPPAAAGEKGPREAPCPLPGALGRGAARGEGTRRPPPGLLGAQQRASVMAAG